MPDKPEVTISGERSLSVNGVEVPLSDPLAVAQEAVSSWNEQQLKSIIAVTEAGGDQLQKFLQFLKDDLAHREHGAKGQIG